MTASERSNTSPSGPALLVGLVWLLMAGIAVWFLWPVTKSYALPKGWVYIAPEIAVQDIFLDGQNVYIAGYGGLVRTDTSGKIAIPIKGISNAPMLRAIEKDNAGQIWVGHGNGVSLVTDDQITAATIAHNNKAGAVRTLLLDAGGQLWGGGEDGLFKINTITKTQTIVPLPVFKAEVTKLLTDTKGGLWVGSLRHGIMHLQAGKWVKWSVEDGLLHPQITSFKLDRNGDVWSGMGFYNKGGAVRFSPDQGGSAAGWQISQSLSENDFAGAKVRAILNDSEGRLWFGHEYDGITVRKNGKVLRFISTDDGLPGSEVTVIRQDASGGIWLGTLKGAVYLAPAVVGKLFSEHAGDQNDA